MGRDPSETKKEKARLVRKGLCAREFCHDPDFTGPAKNLKVHGAASIRKRMTGQRFTGQRLTGQDLALTNRFRSPKIFVCLSSVAPGVPDL